MTFCGRQCGSFPHLREDMLRIILVNSEKIILPELGEKLGTYAQRKLTEQQGRNPFEL